MSKLANMIKNMKKKETSISYELDNYLMSLAAKDTDRKRDTNAPSQVGKCLRARYYARIGEVGEESISPRLKRIFDNGSYMHSRIQDYLSGMYKRSGKSGLILSEVPVIDFDLNICGHTDGIYCHESGKYSVLELKSINSNGFITLKAAKQEHVEQALVYLYCLEKTRKAVREEKDKGWEKKVKDIYSYLEDGAKYTRVEKMEYQFERYSVARNVLRAIERPLTTVVLFYENKDTQDIKEFEVSSETEESKETMVGILDEYAYLNKCVAKKRVPDRIGEHSSCSSCKWCEYKSVCW